MQISLLVFSILAKTLSLGSRLTGRGSGTSISGYVVERYARSILSHLRKKYEKVIYITGTNGKTTTTTTLYQMLRAEGLSVCTNLGGANIFRGIAGAILKDLDSKGRPKSRVLLMEVEEATLPHIMQYIPATDVVLLNVFRDQLDVYGELDTTIGYFAQALTFATTAHVWINGDDQLLMQSVANFTGKITTYSTKNSDKSIYERIQNVQKYKSDMIICYEKNILSVKTGQTKIISLVRPELEAYNVQNIAVAAIVARDCGATSVHIQKAINIANGIFGRGEMITIGTSIIWVYLIKNPAGAISVLHQLSTKSTSFELVFAINDAIADGKDVSWLWDVPFETLLSPLMITQYTVLGTRRLDMLLRLKHAHTTQDLNTQITDISMQQYIENTANSPENHQIVVLATYTAMRQFRALLANKTTLRAIDQV